MNTFAAKVESFRSFAVAHNKLEFAHLCTAALKGEEWAAERIDDVLGGIDWAHETPGRLLRAMRGTFTSRPDGAIARHCEAP